MADAYWRFPEAPYQAAAVPVPLPALKRPRADYADMPGGQDMLGYFPRDEDRTVRVIKDTESIGASYDRYLRSGTSAYAAGEPVRSVVAGATGYSVDDRRVMGAASMEGRSVGYGGGRLERMEPPLPSDASNTLYVEGLPANCSRREVSHIFRPFVGFQEVRLVKKDSKHPDADPLILCFVDFATAAQAAVALEALQGRQRMRYKFDEHERGSANLRLQFARFPGPRSSGGSRGRR